MKCFFIHTLLFVSLNASCQTSVSNQTSIPDSFIIEIIQVVTDEFIIDSYHIVIASKVFNNDILIRGDYGACERIRDGYYLINIDEKLPKKTLAKVLFHELIHVKQYHFNELRIIGNNIGVWFNGEAFNLHYLSVTEYRYYPWEKEAINQTNRLFKKYKSVIKQY